MFNPVFFYEMGRSSKQDFVAIFDTTKPGTASNTLKIPFRVSPFNNVQIDWGDGNVDSIPAYNHALTTHIYSSAGVYTVTIRGEFALLYGDFGDKQKILEILNIGSLIFFSSAFNGCLNLSKIAEDISQLNSLTEANAVFRNCPLTSVPSSLHLNNVTAAQSFFQNSKFTSLPSSMLFTNLSNGSFMFYAAKIEFLPSGITFNNLEIATNMFYNCKLTNLPTGVTLKNLKSGSNMFLGNTINTSRYSQLLIDMAALNSNNNVPFHGGSSKYNSSAVSSRNALIARGWTITDGGQI